MVIERQHGPQGPARDDRGEPAPPNGENTRSRLRSLETDVATLKGEWGFAKWVAVLAVAVGAAYCQDQSPQVPSADEQALLNESGR